MSYQHLNQPGYQIFSRQHCHNNPEIFGEPDTFIDAVSYSESDGYINILPKVRSVPSHDIQELYIRKPMTSTSQILPCAPQGGRCCCNNYWTTSPESFHEHPLFSYAINNGQTVPRRATSAYITRRNTSSFTNNYSDSTSFKSAPTIPTGASHKISDELHKISRNKLPAPMMFKTRVPHPAVPITFTKKHNSKRQSTFDRDERRNSENPFYSAKSQEIRRPIKSQAVNLKGRTQTDMTIGHPKIDVKIMNSEGDATGYKPDIESLDTIERIVATLDEDEAEELSEEHINEIRRMSKFLAPRVPNSVKSVVQKQEVLHEEVKSEDIDTKEEANDCKKKSLHDILDQLENCELSLNAIRAKYNANRQSSSSVGRQLTEKENSEEIFNLREISAKITEIPDEETIGEMKNEEKQSSSHSIVQADLNYVISDIQNSDNVSNEFESKIDCRNSMDDIEALELHRSKSYIINLIDKALSKELGTIPKQKIRREQDNLQDLDTAKAINHIRRNLKQSNNYQGTMEEIVKQEVDLIISSANSNQQQSAVSKDSQPPFIRKLKELRWGHFKHIQQEVRRLEDLERFLDSCGVSCESSY